MLTPQNYTMSIPANGFQVINESGQFVRLIACTGKTSVLVGLDDDPPQLWYPGKGVDVGVNHYDRIKISNPGAGAAVVEIEVGNSRSIDDRGQVALAGMAATLTSILAYLTHSGSCTQVGPLTLAASPGPGTPIVINSASRKELFIQAALTNTGTVYLGRAAANCKDSDCFAVLAPGQSFFSTMWYGGVWGVGSDAAQQVSALTVGV